MRFLAAGTDGLLVETYDLAQALALLDALQDANLTGVLEIVPAARTVLVRFDPLETDAEQLRSRISGLDLQEGVARTGETFEIPVIYDGEDLADVADLLGCSVEEVIRRHSDAIHTVAFTGFAPGFAYMTSDDASFDVPRRQSPRVRIPAGSVALAGQFSGIYPTESPGGWQLLGRTTARMWDLSRPRPALLVPGDRVRFRPVMAEDASTNTNDTSAGSRADRTNACLSVIRTDRPALLQDEGRPGQASQGVSRSGALDHASFHAVNEMLGNARRAPALEFIFGGIEIRAEAPITLAVAGAPCTLALTGNDGRSAILSMGNAFALDAGDTLSIGAPERGMVSYLGIRGGFAAETVMGAASRDTLAGIGAEPLAAGAALCAASGPLHAVNPCSTPSANLPSSRESVSVDIIMGPRDDWFTHAGLHRLTTQEWRVTPEISRVGKRLHGTVPLERRDDTELPSEPTVPGAIQVPHSGQPVIFLADHPVTGGYPVVAVVARHHLDLVAQIPPGASIRFRPLSKDP